MVVHRRIKIEFLPALMNLPFTAIFLFVFYSNKLYWEMFNGIIAGVFWNIQIDWVTLILVLTYAMGIYSLILIVLGLIDLNKLYNKILGIIPSIFLIVMVALLIIFLNVNERVNLDYLFFMLGPQTGFSVYIGATIGIFLFIGLTFIGLWQLFSWNRFNEPKILKTKYKPSMISIPIIISSVLGFSVILMVGFYYPQTMIYWKNVEVIYHRYVNWKNITFIIWILSIILLNILTIMDKVQKRIRKKTDRQENRAIKAIILHKKKIFWVLLLMNIFTIIWESISIELIIRPALSGLWIFVDMSLVAISLISLGPAIRLFYQKVVRDRLYQINRHKAEQVIRFSLISAIVFIPYWIIFYQPLISGPPKTDVPFQMSLKTLNGVEVPFQGDMAYPSFEMQDDTTREYLNLSGEWKFQKGNGSNIHSLSPRTPTFLTKITQGQHLLSYDDSSWENVVVPHSFVYYDDESQYFGVVWYRKWINIPSTFEDRYILLKCLGCNYITDIWIDETYIGYHEGGFTSFAFDVSKYLTPGLHLIAIRVDNPKWDEVFPAKIIPDGCDFFNYGGIVREIYLESCPMVSISRVDFRQTNFSTNNFLDGSVNATIDVVIKCPNPAELSDPTGFINLTIYPLVFPTIDDLKSRETWQFVDRSIEIMDRISSLIEFVGLKDTDYSAYRFYINITHANFWSTKNPNLYAIMVNLTSGDDDILIDQFCTQIGFRNFTTSGTNLILNGANLKLAGVSCHEEYPGLVGRSLTDDHRFNDLLLINSTGSNWWRGSYPFHPMMYIISDRLGLACWEEAPVFWVNEIDLIEGFAREAYQSLWIEILFRDLNRPSILVWSAGNEPWAQQGWYDYLDKTQLFLNRLDPNRILSFACVSSQDWNPGFRNLRLLTPNTYGGTFDGVIGDYYGEISAQLGRFVNNNPGKPLISMEWGMWRGPENDLEQNRCFVEGFQAFTEQPNCQGMTWWIAFDYFGQNYYNSMGIFNHERTWHSITFDSMYAAYTEYTKFNL